jgi:hypothetical protein
MAIGHRMLMRKVRASVGVRRPLTFLYFALFVTALSRYVSSRARGLRPGYVSESVRRIYEVCEALAIRRIMRRIIAS